MHFIESQEELPIPGTHSSYQDYQRKRTDNCCTIWAVLFSVSLFAIAIYSLNIGTVSSHPRTPYDEQLPSRLEWKAVWLLETVASLLVCSWRQRHRTCIETQKTRVCVQRCPGTQQLRLNCSSEDSKLCLQYARSFYETTTRTRNESVKLAFSGQYCIPKDTKLRESMLNSSGLNKR